MPGTGPDDETRPTEPDRAADEQTTDPARPADLTTDAAATPGLHEPSTYPTRMPDSGDPTGPMVVDRAEPSPGSFGDYMLQEELGRGGMGVVYRARQVSLDRPVALKMIKAGSLADEAELQRFQVEAEAVARLDHPGIVPIYEVGERDGLRYFSMRLVDGGNLAGRIAKFRDAPRDAAALMVEVAEAIHHAHTRGILHRDLKPANILVDAAGHPHVTDFGLAKRVEADVELTASGAILGTPAYLSPEQASGRRGTISTATDIYGLGAILYALLAGRAPFGGQSLIDTLQAVKERPPEPPRGLNPGVPRDLETICLKCLAKDPRKRYSGANALADDLRAWLDGRPIAARRVGPAERAWLWCARRPAVAALLAVTALALVGGVAGIIAVQARANANLRASNLLLDHQKRRAEDRETLAIDAVKHFRDAVVGEPTLKNRPELRELRKRLLKEPLEFFRALRDRLQADSDTRPESLGRLIAAGADLGVLTDEIGDRRDAIASYRQALGLARRMVDENPSVAEYRAGLVKLLLNLANGLSVTGQAAESLDLYREAEGIAQDLADAEPANPERRVAVAKVRANLGILLYQTGRHAEALTAFERARDDQKRLADANLGNAEVRLDLARSHEGIGELLANLGRPEEALRSHALSRDLRKRHADAHPEDHPIRGELARSWNSIGDLLATTGHPAEAIPAYDESVAIHRAEVESEPSSTTLRRDLATALGDRGALLADMGQSARALQEFADARAIFARLGDENPGVPQFRDDLASAHYNVGAVLADLGRDADALEADGLALKLFAELADANPTHPYYQRRLAAIRNNIGAIQKRQGDPARALESFRAALATQEKLSSANPDVPTFESDQARSLDNIGLMLDLLGRADEAIEAFRVALPIRRKLVREHPESPDYASELGDTLHGQALVDLGRKQFEPARASLIEARGWHAKALSAYPGNPFYLNKMSGTLAALVAAGRGLGRAAEVEEAVAALAKLKAEDPRYAGLDARLAEVISGGSARDVGERLAMAERAYERDLHAVATRLWAEAVAADPALANDREAQVLYNAACAAALGGSGRAKDTPPPDAEARAKLRGQSLDWLAAERLAWAKFLDGGHPQARPIVAANLGHWLTDPDLAGVRDAEALEGLDGPERDRCRSLWGEVAALRDRASRPAP